MSSHITVCIPSIPPRAALLQRAITSVLAQTYPAEAIVIAVDHDRLGAASTRNKTLFAARTEWIAFLDDDDELYPDHLQKLAQAAELQGADVVYPWFDVAGGDDPFPPEFETMEWNPQAPHSFPITALLRRDYAFAVGGFPPGVQGEGAAGEDWQFWLALRDQGARFAHIPDHTWIWHHDSGNTGGVARW